MLSESTTNGTRPANCRAESATPSFLREPGTWLVLESAQEAFVSIDASGRIVAWNAEAERTFGWTAREIIGCPFRDTIVAVGCERADDDTLPELLGTGDGQSVGRGIELMAVHRDGHEFPVELTISPLADGGRVTFNAFLQDISDRRQAAEKLEQAQLEVIERLALAAEYRDDDTGLHTRRVGERSAEVAAELGRPADEVDLIRRAAPLHDVGKIGIPDAVLLKPGRLTEHEFELVKLHTLIGARLLAGGAFPLLDMARQIALSHHERWDGSGYPHNLAGASIPLVARIVAVVDVFDALTHERPYKNAWPIERALTELRDQRGRQFDPDVVDAFLRMHRRSQGLPWPEHRPAPTAVRLACACCGAHAEVMSGHHMGGQCPNCNSYEMLPLDDAYDDMTIEPLTASGQGN